MKKIYSHSYAFWNYVGRLFILLCGLFVCALGIMTTYRSGMGLGPWDVLHKGVSLHTPLSFGQASIVVGAIVIVVGLLLKVWPGVGTLLNMLLIGIFVDFLLRMNWLSDLSRDSWLLRLPVDALGVFLMGLGTALYISPRLGAGPRDGLMLRLNVLTRVRIAIVRAVIECSACLVGFVLGGTVGIGTILFALGVGPAVEAGFWLIKKLRSLVGLSPAVAHPPHVPELASDLVPLHPELHPVDRRSS